MTNACNAISKTYFNLEKYCKSGYCTMYGFEANPCDGCDIFDVKRGLVNDLKCENDNV